MLQGAIMDMPLMISSAISHAATYHGSTEVVARDVDGAIHRYTYAEAHRRTKRLANALGRLGVRAGDRIGTLAWNTHRHFELFYGVSGSGAVLHPVNPRLFADQIVYIVNHAEDAWLFIDAATLPLAEQLAPRLKTVKGFVLMAERSALSAGTTLGPFLCYEDLLAAESDDYVWPQFDERSASSICYTSGTTGDPKGVVYSHRSSLLVSMLFTEWVYRGGRNGAMEALMTLAPLFHANGWYFPYVAPMTGSKLVLPGRNYEPAMLYELLHGERITITCGVPTMWLTLTDWMERENRTLPHLRTIYSAGTAAPRSLFDKVAAWGVELNQLWGMTEALGLTSPSLKPGALDLPPEQQLAQCMKAGGRAGFGAQLRIVDDEEHPLPHDGLAVGHLRARSPWISSGYFKSAEDALDGEGWLKTGDVASIDPDGYISIVDRSKDLIKSGGEWISSIALENAACGHPEVMQAAVIAAFHPKWQERPLLIVTRRPGSRLDREALLDFLRPGIASWWLPDDVVFVSEMPMTATGKIHKLTLRERFRTHQLPTAGRPANRARRATVDYTDIRYEKKDGVAWVTINRPEVRNAFRTRTVAELTDAFVDARWDGAVGVVVLTGAGDKAFCAGGDQKERGQGGYARDQRPMDVEALHSAIRHIPKPVIAMVNGFAIGGGHVLHVLCDLSIASETAIFGQTGLRVGSVDAGHGTGFLARVVGEKKAREIWYLCRQYSAQDALAMGLVNRVVPLKDLRAETEAWCRELLEKSPTALALAKQSFNIDSEQRAGVAQLALSALNLYYGTEEAMEGRDAFVEKRPVNFQRFRR